MKFKIPPARSLAAAWHPLTHSSLEACLSSRLHNAGASGCDHAKPRHSGAFASEDISASSLISSNVAFALPVRCVSGPGTWPHCLACAPLASLERQACEEAKAKHAISANVGEKALLQGKGGCIR